MGRGRRPFTLIEIVLSMALISLVGSILLVRTKPMLEYYRFNHSCGKLQRELVLARRLAQAATTDIEFEILEKKGGLVCVRKTDEPLCLLGGIKTPIFIPHLSLEEVKKVTLFITSNGTIEGKVNLTVSIGSRRKTIFIDKKRE